MKTRLFVAFLAALLSSPLAHAETYHRFWRGEKLPALDPKAFVQGLNEGLIPATVRVGAGNGLIAYEPVITGGLPGFPDEIALVSYRDKAAYDRLFSMDAGKAYQSLHWRYFDHTQSKSLTPEPFQGAIEAEHAYDFHPSYGNWKENRTTVLVFLRKTEEAEAAFLNRARTRLVRAFREDLKNRVLNRTVLVSSSYWIEYVSAPYFLPNLDGANRGFHLENASVENVRVMPGQGVNLQFQ